MAIEQTLRPPPTTSPPSHIGPAGAGAEHDSNTADISPKKTWLRLSTPSWMFPFKGIYYFASHRFLWPLLTARLLPCVLLSLIVVTTVTILFYLPQVAFLAIFHGFRVSAFINAAFLVLGEANAVIALLFEAFFVDETLVDIFDAVLINEGHVSLVSNGRVVHDEQGLDPRQRLGKALPGFGRVYSPFSLRQIIEFVAFLPLNFIPWVGVPLFLLVTGLRAGPLQHWRYFKLLGLDKRQRKQFEKKMSASHTWFGSVHLALQLVPGFSMLFLLTTAAGSALWVDNLEKRRLAAANARQGSLGADSYVDDPA